MTTTVIGIHGRGMKPRHDALAAHWFEAISHGVSRVSKSAAAAIAEAQWEFVYFGDLSNAYLHAQGDALDETLDLEDRRACLDQLKARKRKSFSSRGVYERLPGKNSIGEFLADVGQPIMRTLGLSKVLIERYAPDYLGYWEEFQADATARLIEALRPCLLRGDRIILIAHCLGSVIAFDALWALRHEPYDWYKGDKIHRLITLGSPLGDETVKKRLLGATASGINRYPANILHWNNVTAEDDYISHDNTVANDYRTMLQNRLVSSIDDETILNLAVRYGRSNAHNATGYLLNPNVSRVIADALS